MGKLGTEVLWFVFSYIKGLLTEVMEDAVTVESMGIGWKLMVPTSVLDRLPGIGGEVKIYTSFQVREEDMTLYGFLTRQDRQMFEMLLMVNGVGPKAAMGVLSTFRADDLRVAIVSEDSKAIAKAPGIGPKTAKRVILDLKDRIKLDDFLPGGMDGARGTRGIEEAGAGMDAAEKEAAEALLALGYSASEAAKAVRHVTVSPGMTSEDVLRQSLRYLAF